MDTTNPPFSAGAAPGYPATAGPARERTTTVSFWSDQEEVFVSVHTDQAIDAVWPTYLDGLRTCYREIGIGHIADGEQVRREDCAALWLVHDRSWTVLGGVRAIGPFWQEGDVERLAALTELDRSPSLPDFVTYLRALIPDGLVELKGVWSAPGVRRLGGVLGCFSWFCNWWFQSNHVICTAGASNNLARWVATGAVKVEGFEPARGYPSEAYRTEPVLWSQQNLPLLADHYRRFVASMIAQLHPARIRMLEGRETIELVHRPERRDELAASGVEIIDATVGLIAEAEGLAQPVNIGDEVGWPWVHYPWRRAAVRLLGPEAYHQIRTDRNRYKLTSNEMALLRDKKVGVIGLSVGGSIAYTLAQEGLCGQLRIADFDSIELSNLNRLAGSVTDLGLEKTTIASRRILELDPFLDIRVWDRGVDSSSVIEFLDGLDLVIEECDSLDVKVMVRSQAARLGIPVVMETNDRGLLDVERFDCEPDRLPFHGLVDRLDPEDLVGLTTDDKVPYVLDILEPNEISAVMAASMVEIDATVSSWPQLASDVALGAALAGHAARKVLLNKQHQRSGRVRVDLDDLFEQLVEPATVAPKGVPVLRRRPPLPDDFATAVHKAAGLAPSGGNAQPWEFELANDHFLVIGRPDGVGMDIGERGTAVACGAAAFNARCVAAAHHRLDPDGKAIEVEVDVDRRGLVARLPLGSETDPALARLARQITERVTNRTLDPTRQRVEADHLERLVAATRAEGARLVFVARENLDPVSLIWAEADRLRYLDPRLHAEMFDELKRPGTDPLDRGLDERTLGLSATDLSKLAVVRRPDVVEQLSHWEVGSRLTEDTRDRLDEAAGLAVVVADGGTPADYVRGGMALQRMWLEASMIGVELQPVSPVFGYARAEEELVELLGRRRGRACLELQRKAWDLLGIDEDRAFILALRVHYGPGPSAISERVSTATRDRDQEAGLG